METPYELGVRRQLDRDLVLWVSKSHTNYEVAWTARWSIRVRCQCLGKATYPKWLIEAPYSVASGTLTPRGGASCYDNRKLGNMGCLSLTSSARCNTLIGATQTKTNRTLIVIFKNSLFNLIAK